MASMIQLHECSTTDRPEEAVQQGEIIWGEPDKQQTQEVAVMGQLERARNTLPANFSGEVSAQATSEGEQLEKRKATATSEPSVRKNLSFEVKTLNAELYSPSSSDSETSTKMDSEELAEGRDKLNALKNTKRKQIKQVLQDDPQLKALEQYTRTLSKQDPLLLNPVLIGIAGVILLLLLRAYL